VEELLVDALAAVLANTARIGRVDDGPGAGPLGSVCVVAPPATLDHVQALWAGGDEIPTELVRFWRLADGARLFEDPDYGQWGLVLLSVAASRQRTQAEFEMRPDDMESGDVVVGEFLGDQELLVYSAHEGVLVALPLDGRGDWYRTAPTLTDFLERYTASLGEKFWESNS
jgi:hypothetical protein